MVYRRRRPYRGRRRYRLRRRGYRSRRFRRSGRGKLRRNHRRAMRQVLRVKLEATRAASNPIEVQACSGTDLQTYSLSFQLADFKDYDEWSTMFEKYRISKIVYELRYASLGPKGPQYNYTSVGAVPTNGRDIVPGFGWVADHDDASNPIGLDEMRQYPGWKETTLHEGKKISMVVKPACLGMLYEGAVTTGYTERYRTWIDCNDTQVPHYGLKFVIFNLSQGSSPPLTPVTIGRLIIRVKAYVAFKDIKCPIDS